MLVPPFAEHMTEIDDPRQLGKIQHNLFDIMVLLVLSVLAGCEGWEEMHDFGEERLDLLRLYGDFENGIPSPDTVARVLGLIDPKQFQDCFISWMKNCQDVTSGDLVAIDGKTVRRSYDKKKGKAAIHMVSAFCVENQQVLGQLKTAEKSNEITAIPALLDVLDISGKLITIDAMGCQTKIAKKIIDRGGDYLLAVKGNQGRLEKAFEKEYSLEVLSKHMSKDADIFSKKEYSHGRDELRLHTVSDLFGEFVDLSYEWPGMKTVGVAISQRKIRGEPAEMFSTRFYISSREMTAERFAEAIRSHWGIENKVHWILDVAMREDDCRIRRENAPENFAVARHIALNLIKKEKSRKGGVKRKQKMMALSERYMRQVFES